MRLFSTTLLSLTAACLVGVPASAWAQCFPTDDQDGDGHAAIICGGDDCDDNDPSRFPGNVEICDANNVDEDCNFNTGGFLDQDRDGFNADHCYNVNNAGVPVNQQQARDCDDQNASVHPIAAEQCNGIDDNCNGAIDDGVVTKVYVDADGDGFGTGPSLNMCAAAGYSTQSGDCDDGNAAIKPGTQICSGTDVLVCEFSGTYAKTTCGSRARCHAQPNGTGVCECRFGIRRNGTCR